jgi:quinol monooxygenase YgiN
LRDGCRAGCFAKGFANASGLAAGSCDAVVAAAHSRTWRGGRHTGKTAPFSALQHGSNWHAALHLHRAAAMLIASLVFDVLPDKRAEFVSAVGEIVESLRSSQGCLACRLVSDCENDNLFVMTSEWDGRTFLDRYLSSAEFSILEGTRILLSDGPELSIDELLSRRRSPRPRRRRA